MSLEIPLQSATDELVTLKLTREEKIGRAPALVGDGSGNLVGNNGVPWVLCRLGGDVNRLVQAYNGTLITPSEGMSISLLVKYREGRVDHYEIERQNGSEIYPGYIPGANGFLPSHHLSHELPGDGTGGWDAVNVYERAFTALRVNSQTVADLTVQVAPGLYAIGNTTYYLDGPVTSVAFAPPGSGSRYDVVTIDALQNVDIVVGGMTVAPLVVTVPSDTIPLAGVYLVAGQTSILEADIFDLRPFTSIGTASSAPSGSAGGDLSGTYPNPTVKQSSVAFALTAFISPTTLATNTNDYNPTGLAGANSIRLSSSSTVNLTGLQGGATGRVLFLHNVGSFDITLVNESGSSSAINRFALTDATVRLRPNGLAIAQYDAVDTRWRVLLSGTGSAGGDVLLDSDGNPMLDSDGNLIYADV